MAGYQPRRGPNVSKFIASLNAIPAADEGAEDDFGIDEDDLNLFMHTEFLTDDLEDAVDNTSNNQNDAFSLGHPTLKPSLNPTAPADFGPGRQPQQSESSDVVRGSNPANNNLDALGLPPLLAAGGGNGDIKNLDFDDDFPLQGLPYMPHGNVPLQNASYQNYGSPNQDFDLTFPSPTSPYALQNAGSPITPSPPNGMLPSPPNGMDPPNGMLPTPPNGSKRAAATDSETLEANSRAAAEEDKRRRNTAASARFRVKKKQREQALEKTAKEMTDKCEQLEQKVGQLEMENKWLRGLVVEKTAKGGEEVAELWRKFKEEDRSNKSAKKGVGTPEA